MLNSRGYDMCDDEKCFMKKTEKMEKICMKPMPEKKMFECKCKEKEDNCSLANWKKNMWM